MKFVFASDSFKGSLASMEIAELLKREARACFPDCECVCLPVADGGEGTMEAVVQACGGVSLETEVADPLGRRIRAAYAGLDEDQALIEMAAASGLPLLRPEERDPLETTSFGTGEMIRDALERGYRRITIAIGGSATNDGGMGKGAEEIYRHGISSIVTTINGPMRTDEAMKRAKELYSCAARRMFRLFKAGMEGGAAACEL